MKPQLGLTVRYQELNREFPAIITHSHESEEGFVDLTVFAKQGQSYRTKPYSEKLEEGHWSYIPAAKK